MPTDFRAQAELLKLTIRREVVTAIENFTRETGVSPAGIRIHMFDTSTTRDDIRQFVVGAVHVSFDL